MKKLILPIIVTSLLIISLFILRIFQDFNLSFSQARQIYQLAKNVPPPQNPYNFLILGLDPRDDQLEKTQVTDTIIIASLNSQKQVLNLISIPRDLWWADSNFKINQIYPSLYDGTSASFQLIKQEFSKVTGQPLSDIFIITTQGLSQLVDLIGGVDVYLESGFTDDQYPNPAYIASPSAQIPIYTTVSFPSGMVHIDSSNISQFVRSRKSSDSPLDGGTDTGRTQRQQLVIDGLVAKLKNQPQIYSYANLVDLYHWWQQQETTISIPKLLKYGYLYRHLIGQVTVQKNSLPLKEIDPKNGVIYHPNTLVRQQWVYLPLTPDYRHLRQFIDQIINL